MLQGQHRTHTRQHTLTHTHTNTRLYYTLISYTCVTHRSKMRTDARVASTKTWRRIDSFFVSFVTERSLRWIRLWARLSKRVDRDAWRREGKVILRTIGDHPRSWERREVFRRNETPFWIIFPETETPRLTRFAHFLLRITVWRHFVGFLFVFDVLSLAVGKKGKERDRSVWNLFLRLLSRMIRC